ncbi:MAG TPA: hypothetical protein VII28_02585 [Puia sp.]
MKKLLTVLAISTFAACGSGSSTTTTDSTVIKTDTVKTMGSDSMKVMMDSTKKMMDTTKKMMDSSKK